MQKKESANFCLGGKYTRERSISTGKKREMKMFGEGEIEGGRRATEKGGTGKCPFEVGQHTPERKAKNNLGIPYGRHAPAGGRLRGHT